MYATVPQGTVATTVAPDWLANELAGRGKIDAPCRDRFVMHLMTAAGASAPADAVFRFTAGEAMQTEDDDEDADRSEEYSDDNGYSIATRCSTAVKPPPSQPSQGRTHLPPFKGGFEVDETSSPPKQ